MALLENGSTEQLVWRLALPVLLEQMLIFGVGLFDTFLAGRISTDATAAIGLAAYVGWLASLLFSLAVTSTTALVARHWGAGEEERANQFFNQSVPLAGLLGIIVWGLLYAAAPGFADLQNMTGETRLIVIRYLRIDAFGHVFTSLSLVGAAALRGTGDMRSPMLVLAVVNVINVIVSTALVYGYGPLPRLGVDGIVAGTVVARICGGTLMLTVLAQGLSGLKLRRGAMRLRFEYVTKILRIGVPAAIDGCLTWIGQFLFMMIVARLAEGELGRAIYAAHIIGIQVEGLTYLPATAWGRAAATLVGQSLGAGDISRARRVGHVAVWQCSLLACGASAAYYFGADAIFRLMHEDALVHEIGIPALRFLAFFQVPLVLAIVYVYSLGGAGDTRYPMLISLCGILLVRVPVAYLCGIVWQGGLIGAWTGMCADVALRGVLAALRYSRGKWISL